MRIDASRFPLIVLHWTGTLTDAELSKFITSMDQLSMRAANLGTHYAVVSCGEAPFAPLQRQKLSNWVASIPADRKKWDLGNFVVAESALARGTVTAMKWLTSRLENIHMFATYAEAEQAAVAQLHAVGCSPGASPAG